MKEKHYLVTGGAGFIGSHLVEALVQAGYSVVVLDDFSTGKYMNLPTEGVEIFEGSVCDSRLVAQAMQGARGCFHLAAVASVTRSLTEWTQVHRVNQSGTVQVFEEAGLQGVPVVYASSAAVYGDNPQLPLSELSVPRPLSPYGLDKLVCEWQAAMGRNVVGLNSVGLRFFNVYGARQDPSSPYSGVISIFMERVRRGQEITIYGDGLQSRDFVYVEDVVMALLGAMGALEQALPVDAVLNVCTGQAVTVRELAELLYEIAEIPPKLHFEAAREGDIRHSLGDASRLWQQLDLPQPRILSEGLESLWRILMV